MKKLLFIIIAMGFCVFSANAALVYKWVDKDGVVNFTDDLSKVPPAYRDRVKTEMEEETSGTTPPTPAQAPTPSKPSLQQGQERNTDINGHDEAWWRERARPLKQRLKEATEKYEEANKQFVGRSEELSRTQQGTKTSFRYRLRELDSLAEERKRYESEVADAENMLKKLSKEAEEAGADPEWLQ
jgi:hypothetical protein